MGDAPAAWVVDDSLDASGESQTESPAPSDFARVDMPAALGDTDNEFGHSEGNIPNFIGSPSTPIIGHEGRGERGTGQGTPKRKRDQHGCVALRYIFVTISVER